MKKISIVVLLILTVVTINSCKDKCEDLPHNIEVEIPDSLKLALNIGDSIIYKSNLDNYDTIKVVDIKTHYYGIGSVINGCNLNYDGEYITIDLLYHDSIEYQIQQAYKTYPNITMNIEYKDFYFYYTSAIIGSSNYGLDKYYYNDSTFYNVYFWSKECNSSALNDYQEIALNNKYGILYYTNCTGETYNLFKYIKSK